MPITVKDAKKLLADSCVVSSQGYLAFKLDSPESVLRKAVDLFIYYMAGEFGLSNHPLIFEGQSLDRVLSEKAEQAYTKLREAFVACKLCGKNNDHGPCSEVIDPYFDTAGGVMVLCDHHMKLETHVVWSDGHSMSRQYYDEVYTRKFR